MPFDFSAYCGMGIYILLFSCYSLFTFIFPCFVNIGHNHRLFYTPFNNEKIMTNVEKTVSLYD